MPLNRVRPLKEDAAEGFDEPFDRNNDALDVGGVYVQSTSSNDTSVAITRDSSNNLTFVDPVLGSTRTLSQLAAAASVQRVQVTVDFGFGSGQEGDAAAITVAASWVTSGSMLICSPCAIATTDHDPDDYAAEGIAAYAANIVPGVSFDVLASCNYYTWGKYVINVLGV